MMAKFIGIGLVMASCSLAWGDTVYMKDGTTREGQVVRESPDEVVLRVDSGGIKASVNIPRKDVDRVETAAKPPAVMAKPPAVEVKTTTATKPSSEYKLDRRGFLVDLWATALGNGPDDPARLPEGLKKLWDTAVRREVLGNKVETLEALQALDDAFSALPDGLARLDGISRRERNGEPFGAWLARVHWEQITAKYTGGQFDLKDVRESERKILIGIMREKQGSALEPLKPYFPPMDEKTGKPKPFNPTQLQGISATNALEVKKQASYASAILLAEMKLEPQMPAVDRVALGSQMQTVTKILSRALELEPAARAAAEKAERERKLAEERAKRGG